MTVKLGLATVEAIGGTPVAQADVVVQWLSIESGGYAPTVIRPAAGRPLLFLESRLGPKGYRERLITGQLDQHLLALRAQLPANALVRFDHEMDGPKLDWRPWSGMDPGLWKDGYYKVESILGPLVWCPTSNVSRWAPYWVGKRHVSMVGWDQYDHGATRMIPKAWQPRIQEFDRIAPGIAKCVCEFASARIPGARGRAKWLRSLGNVPSGVGPGKVWGACYFNISMRAISGDPKDPDWTMTPAMARVWNALAQG